MPRPPSWVLCRILSLLLRTARCANDAVDLISIPVRVVIDMSDSEISLQGRDLGTTGL